MINNTIKAISPNNVLDFITSKTSKKEISNNFDDIMSKQLKKQKQTVSSKNQKDDIRKSEKENINIKDKKSEKENINNKDKKVELANDKQTVNDKNPKDINECNKNIDEDKIKELAEETGIEPELIIQLLSGELDEFNLNDVQDLKEQMGKLSKLLNSLKDDELINVKIIDNITSLLSSIQDVLQKEFPKNEELLNTFNELKEQINEINVKLNENFIYEQVASEIHTESAKANNQLKDVGHQNLENGIQQIDEVQIDNQNIKVKNESSKNGDSETKKDNDKSDFASKVEVVNIKTSKSNNHPVQFISSEVNNITSSNVENMSVLTNRPTMQNVDKADVFNQIIESAKVMVTDDKSEMIMKLKPDNLGKLALQLVTERGMMMAKFTAESQQVKEIIESNLADLRQALEEQGFNIQSFSVSVGTGDSGRQSFSSGNGLKRRRNFMNVDYDAVSNYDKEHVSINPYEISESSIDFTA